MALTKEQKDALAMGAQTAGYGAAIGAPIGGPVGAGIGAGVGFLAGGAGSLLFGEGESEYEKQRQEDIAELRRRQEMGLLGLTEEERANLSAQLIDHSKKIDRHCFTLISCLGCEVAFVRFAPSDPPWHGHYTCKAYGFPPLYSLPSS